MSRACMKVGNDLRIKEGIWHHDPVNGECYCSGSGGCGSEGFCPSLGKKKGFESKPWEKELALCKQQHMSQLQFRLNPWPGNFHCCGCSYKIFKNILWKNNLPRSSSRYGLMWVSSLSDCETISHIQDGLYCYSLSLQRGWQGSHSFVCLVYTEVSCSGLTNCQVGILILFSSFTKTNSYIMSR